MTKISGWVVGILFAGAILSGCGSSDAVKVPSAEERFAHAKTLFDNRDYLEAINEFTVITLQHQGSAFAADAQYYLAECRFLRGEFLLGAFEYQVLKRNYPASNRVAEAQYKVGLCYYNLSPKSTLDQQYTRKGIDELQAFVEYYPGNQLIPDAETKIRELTTRLAKKQFETARLYAVMEYYRAALLSFDEVIEKYHDTEYAPEAYSAKVELLMSRRHYREARDEADRFLKKYPNSVLRAKLESLRQASDTEVAAGKNVDSNLPPKPFQPQELPQL
jgi:outer membrane protein assembly factor BamD